MDRNNMRGASGFPVRWRGEQGKHHENEFLYGMEELFFCSNYSTQLIKDLESYYKELDRLNFPNHIKDSVLETDSELSHDQITSHSCFSIFYLYERMAHEFYWKNTKFMFLKGRFVPPKTYIMLAIFNKSIIGFLALPLLYILCAWTMFVGSKKDHDGMEDLSGELLYLVMIKAVEHDKTLDAVFKPVRWIVKKAANSKYNGVNQMVKDYFKNIADNPIVQNVDISI